MRADSATTHALLNRRTALGLAVAAGMAGLAPAGAANAAPAIHLDAVKSPGCQCCEGWAAVMRSAGFDVAMRALDDTQAFKAAHGVPDALQSCHTALVQGYVIEGHVPPEDIRRLLAERPQAKGLAVPGMEPSSPGMDPGGDTPHAAYKVVLFGAADGDHTWAEH